MDIKNAEWLRQEPVLKMMSIIIERNLQDEFRFVGGCVRNSLMNIPISDIDVATTLHPTQVIKLFQNYIVVKTGLQHGTVTIIIDHVPFEITTLRLDVTTDGRHAEVQYIQDWVIDSCRRDFTINSLYADFEGNVFDYHDGVKDIQEGKIKFVGDPKQRIKEDYLRILRMYRFQAYYGKSFIDPASEAAACCFIDGLNSISAERKTSELLKILSAPKAGLKNTIRDMDNAGVLKLVVPFYKNPYELYKLVEYTEDPILLLSSLLPNYKPLMGEVGGKMRLSTAQTRALINDVLDDRGLVDDLPESIEAAVYTLGFETWKNQIIKCWAYNNQGTRAELDRIIQHGLEFDKKKLKLPVTGNDLLQLGISGAMIGSKLRELDQIWIDSRFKMNKEELLSL